MGTRIFVVLILCCFACQSGQIPCPKPKKVKLEKSAKRRMAYELTARAEPEAAKVSPRTTRTTIKEIQHVDIEEWDCPRPGARKYLPKAIKENIKRNMVRVTTDSAYVAH